MNKKSIKLFFALVSIFVAARAVPQSSEETAACDICFENYTENSIIIQHDCNEQKNPHFCLSCAEKISNQPCPFCRNRSYKVHDPRVNKQSYERVHHRQKVLSANEQQALRSYLNMNSQRLSLKNSPDTVQRTCCTCHNEIPEKDIVLTLSCNHVFCLEDAAKLLVSGGSTCPQCKKGPMTILDPLEKNQHNQIVLKYLHRAPTAAESSALKKIRTCNRIKILQDHILPQARISLSNAPAYPYERKNPIKQPLERDDNTFREHSKHVDADFDLPIVNGFYPLMADSNDEIELNKLLPKQLNPKEWQIIVQEDGTLARIKKQSHQQRPAYTSRQRSSEKSPDLLSCSNGDLIAGLCIGLLIGQDYHKPDYYTPKPAWLLYGSASAFAYHLIQRANPGRKFEADQALRWAMGIGAGIAIQASLCPKN